MTQPTPDDLRKEIKRTREMTNKPFGVNLTILPTINPPPYADYAQVILDEGIKIVETAGLVQDYVPRFKNAGCIVLHKCTTIRHSLSAIKVSCKRRKVHIHFRHPPETTRVHHLGIM